MGVSRDRIVIIILLSLLGVLVSANLSSTENCLTQIAAKAILKPENQAVTTGWQKVTEMPITEFVIGQS